MSFTLRNCWSKRKSIIAECHWKGACKTEFARLISATDKTSFKQVLLDNYNWVNENLSIEPKFDYASNLLGSFIRIELNSKWGFICAGNDKLIWPIFDWAGNFIKDIAIVKLDGKFGIIRTDGSYLVEPKFDYIWNLANGSAMVELDDKQGKIDKNGNEFWY